MKDTDNKDISVLDSQEITQPEPTQKNKRRKWWKKILIWFFGIIVGILILIATLTALLYVPSIQDWITQSSISSIEKATGLDVEIGKIRIGFPLKLKVEKVRATDPQTGKVVGDIGSLSANVSIMPILKGAVIPISGIRLDNALLDYTLPNDSLHIRADIGELKVMSYSINLKNMEMAAKKLKLHNADVDMYIVTDTIPETEPGEPSNIVVLFDHADLFNITGDILLLPDSTRITVQLEDGKISDGEVNLKEGFYQAKKIKLEATASSLGTEIDFVPLPWRAKVDASKVRYGGPYDVKGIINQLYYEVGDGWKIEKAKLQATKDSTNFIIDDLYIKLDETFLAGHAHIPFDGWMPDSIGTTDLLIAGKVKPVELTRFAGEIEGLPNEVFDLSVTAKGNMEQQVEANLALKRENAINLKLKAHAKQILSEKHRRLSAEYRIYTGDHLMNMLVHFLNKGKVGEAPSWQIPSNIGIVGKASYSPALVSANFILKNELSQGDLDAALKYKPLREEYVADLKLHDFNIRDILPNDSIGNTSGSFVLNGRGTDLYSPKTSFHIKAAVDSIAYDTFLLKQITLLSELNDNQFYAAIDSPNEGLQMTAQADATIKRDELVGSINVFVDTIIPAKIGLDISLLEAARLELRSSIRSNMKENHQFLGEVENFYITTDRNKIHPTNTYIKANTSDKAMDAEVTSGDLSLKFETSNGLNDFSSRVKKVISEIEKSLSDSIGQVNMAPWIEHYPNMKLKFTMGRNNLLRAYLDEYRVGAKSATLDLTTTTGQGLSGLGVVSYLQADTFRVDNIDLVLRQDSLFFTAVSTIHKERFRNQPPFHILLSLSSNVKRSEAYLNWLDSKEHEFINLGLELWNKPNGDLTFGFTPDPIVLAYNVFNVTDNDYITLPKGNTLQIDANMELVSSGGAAISLKGIPSDEGHLTKAIIKDLKLSQLDGIAFVPDLKGLLNVEVDWLQLPDTSSLYKAHLSLDGFEFEKKDIGTLELFADASTSEHEQAAKAKINLNHKEVISADYFNPMTEEKNQRFAIIIKQLPLDKANPFLPAKYAELSGQLDGGISNYDIRIPIREAERRPYYGEVRLVDAKLYTPIANETYTLDSRPISVSDGKVILNKFSLTANNRQMLLNGTMDLEDNFNLNVRATGDDILLLNSEQTRNTMLFGIVNADTDLKITGPVQALTMRGNISLLGNTNVTYQSQKSELKNRNRYKDLVTFTDFSDTLFVAKRSAVDSLSLGGMDIRLGLHIDPATKINAILDQDENYKVSIQGGGDFNLVMPPYGEMLLSGTYDIEEGDVYINFPPISRKFIIRQGSRVTWSGDLMEPQLDFKATSRIKSNVTTPGEPSRQVDFDVSVIAEDRLDQLKLRFETEAVQDLGMKNLIAGMSPEEQNRQSIMLLATGLFLSSTGAESRGFDVNSAVSSLLASQINSLAGEALDAEINLGISDGTNAYGQGTNYSYSISKSFYNDRINFTIGGKMVTGQAATGLRQSFIDNISLDYRLDKAGTHYIRAFHNKDYENLLDGEVTETGAGYVIRRRLHSLKDLFKFSKPKSKSISPEDDTPIDASSLIEVPKDTLALPKEERVNGQIERNREE